MALDQLETKKNIHILSPCPSRSLKNFINVNDLGHLTTVILEMSFEVVSLYSKDKTNHYRPSIRNEQTWQDKNTT